MERFIILDRDGVINVEKNYLYKIEDFQYECGAVEGLQKLSGRGYKFIVITNQAGIARGYYSEEDYFKLMAYMEEDLRMKGVIIEKSYFCPHHPEGSGKYGINCNCRKPGTENFLKAVEEFDIDVENSYMIGDRVTDLIPANILGIRTVLVRTGYGRENESKLAENHLDSLVVENISEFVSYLENE